MLISRNGAAMQHVLVHIDQGLGPVGAWGYTNDGRLSHFYPESLDTAISGRARLVMAQRGDVSIPDWMDLIADTDPTFLDEYKTCQVADGVPLSAVVAEFRRTWIGTD